MTSRLSTLLMLKSTLLKYKNHKALLSNPKYKCYEVAKSTKKPLVIVCSTPEG